MKTDNTNRKSRIVFDFEKRVENTAAEYSMLEKGDRITVALSGGADSVSLLIALCGISQKKGICVSACHLDHGIRGKEAERDRLFAKSLCEKYGVEFYSEQIDVPKLCEKYKESTETVARKERYAFFDRAKCALGSDKIATAHTMSDNTETVLFNMCRGSSADGMCGIPPVRDYFIRPLIKTTRKEVEEFLSEIGQEYVTDSTNADVEYTRNFLRSDIIPMLKRINPSLDGAVSRMSDSLRNDKIYFSEHTEKLLGSALSASEMVSLPRSLMTRYILGFCRKNLGNDVLVSENRITAIISAVTDVCKNGGEKSISLPNKCCINVSRDGLNISEGVQKTECGFNIPLSLGQNIINENYAVYVSATSSGKIPDVIKNEEFVYRLYINIPCSSDIINNDIFARNRLAGDKIVLGGMSRLLKKVFSESGLSLSERKSVPVICSENGVIAVPFFTSPCDSAKATSDKIAYIAFYKRIPPQNSQDKE